MKKSYKFGNKTHMAKCWIFYYGAKTENVNNFHSEFVQLAKYIEKMYQKLIIEKVFYLHKNIGQIKSCVLNKFTKIFCTYTYMYKNYILKMFVLWYEYFLCVMKISGMI